MSDVLSSVGDTRSLTFTTYHRLRTRVLTGGFQPSEKLKVLELAEQFEVSPGVVREALSRLTSEELVVATPQRGFRVASISAEDVKDLTQARVEIELACIRHALTRGTVVWESGIVGALHRLIGTPSHSDALSEPWADEHAQFHDALVAACESKWLLRVRKQLFIQGERYRWINVRMSLATRDLGDEHSQLAAAAIARDVGRTSELMEHHLRLTETLTLRSLAAV